MANKKIINTIRNSKYWQCDGPCLMQLTQTPLIGFSRIAKYHKGLKYSPIFFIFNNHYGYQMMTEDNSIGFIKFLVDKDKKNKDYIKSRINIWKKLEKKTFAVVKNIDEEKLAKMRAKDFYKLIHRFSEYLIDTWSIAMILEGNGIYFEHILTPKVVGESGLSESMATSYLSALIVPDKPSFGKTEHNSLLKISLEIINNNVPGETTLGELKVKYPSIFRSLVIHQKSFHWVRNNYKDTRMITLQEFLEEAQEIAHEENVEKIEKEIDDFKNLKNNKKEKSEIFKKIKISKETKKEIELFAILGWWHDQRKRINLQSSYFLTLFLRELSRRIGFDFIDTNYLTDSEIKKFLVDGRKPNIKVLKERQKTVVYILYNNGKFDFISGGDAKVYEKELFDSIKKHQKTSVDGLKGYVACLGSEEKVTGKINIVMDPKIDEFEKGSILVSSMTRPEFVPFMKDAKAIITNEGGITSHAAIISRELNVPCIIGTKVATYLLKNDDEVEMDMKTGIIKIVNK